MRLLLFLISGDCLMKRFLYLVLTCLLLPLEGAKKAPYISLEDKNKQADKAFIDWVVDTPGSYLSEDLGKILTPIARDFLVNESQLPFTEYLNKEQLEQKVKQVRKEFEKRYLPSTAPKMHKSELQKLIKEIIIPRYEFQINPEETFDPLDKYYNELLQTLSLYSTGVGTTLKDWALSFLTSESQFVALSILRRETVGGKFYNNLNDIEQLHLLTLAGEVITRRFIQNLQAVKTKYHFEEPPFLEVALKKRINQFLFEKFSR